MNKTIALVTLAILASSCQKAPDTTTTATSAAALQCHKDTDCKGDRICEEGSCKAQTPPAPQAPRHVQVVLQPIKEVAPQAKKVATKTPDDGLDAVRKIVLNKPFWQASSDLMKSGYEVQVDPNRFSHVFAGVNANCTDDGCFVPWRGKNKKFCTFSRVDHELRDPSDWGSEVMSSCR